MSAQAFIVWRACACVGECVGVGEYRIAACFLLYVLLLISEGHFARETHRPVSWQSRVPVGDYARSSRLAAAQQLPHHCLYSKNVFYCCKSKLCQTSWIFVTPNKHKTQRTHNIPSLSGPWHQPHNNFPATCDEMSMFRSVRFPPNKTVQSVP